MKIKFMMLGLAASLCFNIFFIVGFFSGAETGTKMSTPAGRAAYISKELNLSEDQQKTLNGLQVKMQGWMEEVKQRQRKQKNAILAEIEIGKMNPDKVRVMLKHFRKNEEELRSLQEDNMLKFVKTLRPEQRKRMSEMIKKKKYF